MIPEKVKKILEENSLQALEFEEGATPTAAAAAEKIGVSVGQIAKSMLMRGKDGLFRMFVIAGDKRLSSGKVKQLTGAKHSMCSSEEIRNVTGFYPGAVCPFGVDGIEIFIDKSLEQYDQVYPAAGTDASGVPTTFTQLIAITGGKVSDITSDITV